MPPPPPPRRKYKSIGTSTERAATKFECSRVHVESYLPGKENLRVKPKFPGENFQKFRILSTAATQTESETPRHRCIADNHSQTDNVVTVDKSASAFPSTADFCANAHTIGSHKTMQTVRDMIDFATSTQDLQPASVDRCTNTEVLTVDKSVSFKPITSDFSCNAIVHCGIDVETCTDVTIAHDTLDRLVQSTRVADFSVNVTPSTGDASCAADIRLSCRSTGAQTWLATRDIGVEVGTIQTDNSSNTEIIKLKESGTNAVPVLNNAEVQFDGFKPDAVDISTNTDTAQRCDVWSQFQPSTSDAALDPIVVADTVHKMDSAIQVQPYVRDTAIDPIPGQEILPTRDFALQVQPTLASVGVDPMSSNETTQTRDIASQIQPVLCDSAVDPIAIPSPVRSQDFTAQMQPVMCDYALDPIAALSTVEKQDFTIQFGPVLIDTAVGSIQSEVLEASVQARPRTADVEIDCIVDTIEISVQTETLRESVNVLNIAKSTANGFVNGRGEDNVMPGTHCDVATDTSDLQYREFDENEIGTYVGQVNVWDYFNFF